MANWFSGRSDAPKSGAVPPAPPAAAPASRGRLDNDAPLHPFSDLDNWTIGDACEGTQIFGGTGSGKTSGSGAAIARAFLRAGFGGLVLTAKPDELDLWRKYCAETGRSNDLVVVSPDEPNTINFLRYESEREAAKDDGKSKGVTTYDIVSLLLAAVQGGQDRESRDPYWDNTVRQLLSNAIDLIRLAGGTVDLLTIVDVVRTAPQSKAEADTLYTPHAVLKAKTPTAWALVSRCGQMLRAAHANRPQGEARDDLGECRAYWMEEFPALDPKTRTSIVSTFMSKATGMLRRPFRRLFCGGTTDAAKPEATFGGKIVVIDLPIKTYNESGRVAQILYKTIWQRAVERRTDKSRPVFLWADESQYFVSPQDMLFQQTARSARAATVYLTQSVSNYYAMLGEGKGSTATTDSLLGNLQTKIFHANSDPVTNEWAERVFGKYKGRTRSTNMGAEFGIGSTEAYLPVVAAIEFTTLRKGGQHNDWQVDAWVFQGGRLWHGAGEREGEPNNAIKVAFTQS